MSGLSNGGFEELTMMLVEMLVGATSQVALVMLHFFSTVVRYSTPAHLSVRSPTLAAFATMHISRGGSTGGLAVRRVRTPDGILVTPLCALVQEKVRSRHATSNFGRPR